MIKTLKHTFEPRGAAAQLFKCREPEVLLSGPAGTGKSRAALEKLHLMMLVNKGARGLIVRKTATSLASTALETFREWVIPQEEAAGLVRFYGGSAQESAQYRYANGSVIRIGGMDKATRIMSSEYDVAFVQEAIELTEDDIEAITTRLRNGRVSFQQLIMDTNPGPQHHWLYKRSQRGQTRMLHSKHRDNPVYYTDDGEMTPAGEEYIRGKLMKLTGVRRQRLYKGLWVSAEGLVYDNWDPSVHIYDPRGLPPDTWERYWTVDFGFTNPFVLQCWAEDPDGRLWLYRELYHTRKLVEDHARDIMSVIAPGGSWIEPKPRKIICDHDAEDRATLARYLGMATVPAKKGVSDGIQAVSGRLAHAGDARPRLFLCRNATVKRDQALVDAGKPASTEEEFLGYAWNEAKDAPVKEDDHGMDATRYMVADRDLVGEPNIRWL